MATATSSAVYLVSLLIVSSLVSGQIRYSIPEELDQFAFVGNIAEDLKLVVWELSARTFRLISDETKQYLGLNLENGILFIHERIDREQLCGQRSICSLLYKISLDNPLEMHRLTVEIIDVNDNSPGFSKDEFSLRIFELIPPGTRFPLESAHDPDVGTNTVSTYQISPNEYFDIKVQKRSDGDIIAELLLEKSLDREKQSTIHFILTAIDGGIPQRTGTAQFIVIVADVNDNAPAFDHELYRANLRENSPKGTLVTQVSAVDLDEGTNGELVYSFTSHTSQATRELFSLDPESGVIRVKGILDFEQSHIYELGVEVMDRGPYALVGHTKIMVRLIDVNDNVPKIDVTSASNTVPEDAQIGTVLAVISVSDPDSGENGNVHCKIDRSVPFKLQQVLSNNYNLVTSDTLDRETVSLYNISISAWDRGFPPLSARRHILITVSDINDNAPRFTQSLYNVFLMENNTPGASIFAVTALDADLDQNGVLSYSVMDSQKQDVSSITINSKSGTLFAVRSFDYEEVKKFQIKVQAQDAGFTKLSSTAIVNIIILDQNDNAPVIVSPLLWNNTASVEIVRQSLCPGYLVTKIIATDADSGQNKRLSFQTLEVTDPSLFDMGLHSGEIKIVRNFKNEDTTTQRMIILVKDNGQPSLACTATIFVWVLANITEKMSVELHQPRNSSQFSELNIYLIIIFGSTSFIFLVIIILLLVLKCKQNRNVSVDETRCCIPCRKRHSSDGFNQRAVRQEILNYSGVAPTLPVSGTYHYAVCLSSESSKSDFLYLKPTMPPNNENYRATSVSK
ncbi:protocadherin-10-like [Pristis pectinata]|uniref:protocadherin-10-like n=1 Tax=Pristis pectinata TaxID=685728 RepID=UPI00223E8231|nr:protocadherin-10-like [Pristis pectinata]